MEVYLASPWVPPEWVRAHGLEPRGVWAADRLGMGAFPLAAGVCAFAEAVAQFTRNHSESAVVLATHCDQLRRSFDVLAGNGCGNCFLFNLPATVQTPAAEAIFCSELERLGRFLVGRGGHAPASPLLRAVVDRHAAARTRLLRLATACSAQRYAAAIARFHWDGAVDLPGGPDLADEAAAGPPRSADGLPLALVGGPLPKAEWDLFDRIEAAGGRVVLNATEGGEHTLWQAAETGGGTGIEEDSSALLRKLTRQYLDHCVDVFQRPNQRLYQWLEPRLALRQVRGIVLRYYVGCDLWRAEAASFREAFGLPVLLLEANETSSGLVRERGRLEAFVETLT